MKRELTNNSCLVLLAHGSKNSHWKKPFEKLACDLKREVGEDKVFLCFMEHATPGYRVGQPSMGQVVKELADSGMRHLRILPLFMASGNHLREDIPTEVAAAQAESPQLSIELLPPIGEHPLFLELLRKLARESVSTALHA
jgi:sirohydrochlorin cobaltochelatase